MELSHEEWKQAQKGIKRYLSTSGWTLLIYYAIMNVAVIGFMVVEVVVELMHGIVSDDASAIERAIMNAAESAWGYFLAAAVGFVILLLWKKPRYLKEEIFAKGAPMKAGNFFIILCIFLSGQTVFQLGAYALELLLNTFGYTISEGLESLQTDPDNFSMFLYAGILAPITEEILFRGLIQRSLLPFGKKFAILISSLTFGLFHGNLIQTPYAFAVGLVLGYVAAEYNILWAMVLHMINNLVLGDLLYRILGGFSDDAVNMIIWIIILAFTVAAVILMIVKRKEIAAYLRAERMNGAYLKCYFTCAGTIVLIVIMGLNILMTTFALVTPL
ncbi:MAG: CPBP family intramembrane metalloprotease [Oscillospiraceae bacterium]|nr:CPBP family intramembrane metalloprotease [Oscillospiraceae bacterium]